MITLAFSCGDINGIGPEICFKTINKIFNPAERKIILFCPANVFVDAKSRSDSAFSYIMTKANSIIDKNPEYITVVDIGNFKQATGKPTKDSGKASLAALIKAGKLTLAKEADAIITAPISKTSFKLAGVKYPGQTELLAELSGSKNFLMMFLSEHFICALATIHEPVRNVSRKLSAERVKSSLKILMKSLEKDFGIADPKIAVLGLNPHAGEDGKIGTEEIEFIRPAIRSLKNNLVEGPFVPDAFFANHLYRTYSAVLGMYHDQVLIPFKMLNFNNGVNFSSGLPIIRTSPDHGTAFDIAGNGVADPSSMIEAVKWAEIIIHQRRKNQRAR